MLIIKIDNNGNISNINCMADDIKYLNIYELNNIRMQIYLNINLYELQRSMVTQKISAVLHKITIYVSCFFVMITQKQFKFMAAL